MHPRVQIYSRFKIDGSKSIHITEIKLSVFLQVGTWKFCKNIKLFQLNASYYSPLKNEIKLVKKKTRTRQMRTRLSCEFVT